MGIFTQLRFDCIVFTDLSAQHSLHMWSKNVLYDLNVAIVLCAKTCEKIIIIIIHGIFKNIKISQYQNNTNIILS